MSIIGLKKQQWDDIESKLGGFSLCPAGSGLLFEITSHREGIYTDKKTGQEVEYITLACSHTDASGIKHDHWEFFNLTDKDLPYIKGFLEKIERQDIFDMGEDAEWSVLYGTAYTCDIRHRVKDKETKELQSNMVRNTITAISHEDGSVVPNWQEQVGLESLPVGTGQPDPVACIALDEGKRMRRLEGTVCTAFLIELQGDAVFLAKGVFAEEAVDGAVGDLLDAPGEPLIGCKQSA